eukprot:4865_1
MFEDTPTKSTIGGDNDHERTPLQSAFSTRQSHYITENTQTLKQLFEGKPLSYKVKYVLINGLKEKYEYENMIAIDSDDFETDQNQQTILSNGASEFYKLTDTDKKRLSTLVKSKSINYKSSDSFFAKNKQINSQ